VVVRPAIKRVPSSVVRDTHKRIVRCGLVIVHVSSDNEDKLGDAMEVTAGSLLFESARLLVRIEHFVIAAWRAKGAEFHRVKYWE
jgi:hypothetical protein